MKLQATEPFNVQVKAPFQQSISSLPSEKLVLPHLSLQQIAHVDWKAPLSRVHESYLEAIFHSS